MSWEQHRFAVERAVQFRRDAANRINDHCMECGMKVDADIPACRCIAGPTFAGAALQGEANASDAEMLGEVADFLKSLEGYDDRKGSIGFLNQPELGQAFIAEWNKTIATISVFCDRFSLPKPDMIFTPEWQACMSNIAGQRIASPLIYAGVRVRFGKLAPMDVLV